MLMRKNYDDMKAFNFVNIVDEIRCKVPFLFKLLRALLDVDGKCSSEADNEKLYPRLTMCYSIIMQQSCHELSLMQRMTSVVLLDSIAEKKVFCDKR